MFISRLWWHMSALIRISVCRRPLTALSASNCPMPTISPELNSCAKLSTNSLRMCTYKIMDLRAFEMNTCTKMGWGGLGVCFRQKARNLPNALESHRCQKTKTNCHGIISLQKVGGQGGLEV